MHRGVSASPHAKVPLWGRRMAQGPGCLGSPGGCRCLGAPGAWCSMSPGAPRHGCCRSLMLPESHIMGVPGSSGPQVLHFPIGPISWVLVSLPFHVPISPISPSAPHHAFWGPCHCMSPCAAHIMGSPCPWVPSSTQRPTAWAVTRPPCCSPPGAFLTCSKP